MVIAIIPSLDGHDIDAYATALFNDWQLGQKDKNNGILLLVSMSDREIAIEAGYGLEKKLTNDIGNAIIQEKIIPFFRKGDYAIGILKGVDSILLVLDAGYIPQENFINSNPAK